MNYLLSASLAMAVFYAVYWLGLRYLTFHGLNRMYLLGSLGLSLGLPLVKMPVPAATEPAVAVVSKTLPMPTDGRLPEPFRTSPEPSGPDWSRLGWGMYAVMVAFVAARLVWRLNRIRRLARQDGEEIGDLLVVPTTGGSASFFRLVLLNGAGLSSEERALVLAHEAEHARLGHSYDRLALEVLTVAFWFNPVMYAYARSLAHLHELDVDARLVARADRRAYANLLLKIAQPGFALANAFARRPLRDRLLNLFQTKPSSAMKKSLYLLVIPVAAFVVWACQRELPATDEVSVPTNKLWVIDHPEKLALVSIFELTLNKGKTKVIRATVTPLKGSQVRRIMVERREPFQYADELTMIGYVTVETAAKIYRFPFSHRYLNDLITGWAAANTNRFFTRISLTNDKFSTPYASANEEYDCLIFKKISGVENPAGYQSINVPKGKSPVFKLDDRELSETELRALSREEFARIQSVGVDPPHVAKLEYGWRGLNGKVFFSTKLVGGAVAKRLPRSAKP